MLAADILHTRGHELSPKALHDCTLLATDDENLAAIAYKDAADRIQASRPVGGTHEG